VATNEINLGEEYFCYEQIIFDTGDDNEIVTIAKGAEDRSKDSSSDDSSDEFSEDDDYDGFSPDGSPLDGPALDGPDDDDYDFHGFSPDGLCKVLLYVT